MSFSRRIWNILAAPARPAMPMPTPWEQRAPLIGTIFVHCDLRLVVIGHGRVQSPSDGVLLMSPYWQSGVLCNYRDDRGTLRDHFFTPSQWDGLTTSGRVKPHAPPP